MSIIDPKTLLPSFELQVDPDKIFGPLSGEQAAWSTKIIQTSSGKNETQIDKLFNIIDPSF